MLKQMELDAQSAKFSENSN